METELINEDIPKIREVLNQKGITNYVCGLGVVALYDEKGDYARQKNIFTVEQAEGFLLAF